MAFNTVMTLHNLEHIPEDILRFFSPDNFWCFSYERSVNRYTGYSSNCKNIEYSFAKAECRRELMLSLQPEQDDHQASVLHSFDQDTVSIYMHACRLVEYSFFFYRCALPVWQQPNISQSFQSRIELDILTFKLRLQESNKVL